MKYLICPILILAAACATAPSNNVAAAENQSLHRETAPVVAGSDPAGAGGEEPGGAHDPKITAPPLPIAAKVSSPTKPTISMGAARAPDPLRQASFAEAMLDVEERQRVFGEATESVSLEGSFTQGGIIFGKTSAGARVRLDGEHVMVGKDGRFVIGFGRDSALSALLTVSLPDGVTERRSIEIADREFPVDRIDGLDQSKVSGFTEEQLEQIAADSAKKKAARKATQDIADWAGGFDWPVTGRISGVFGSQRILNGEPKRPHSGVDVARPAGTPVRAPAAGIVRLAETDMYFEGGLVLVDHGHWLESAFLHMSRLDVEPGQRVEKGDIIGAVGATGRVTGAHLHWSVKWVGRLVDPQLLAGEMEKPAESSAD